MAIEIDPPKDDLEYKPEPRTLYKTTTFRLTETLVKELKDWAEECADDSNDGSLNDLVRQILEWGLKHKKKVKK